MENVIKLSEIESKPIPRILTGFDELDYIYGYSRFPNNVVWGMPIGKISLWAGVTGIGKSRLCIEVAKNIAKSSSIWKILYFQTESTLDDFAGWAKDTSAYKNFFCSGEDRIDEIIKTIYKLEPHVVFIDSVNEIEEFGNGNKKETRRLIKGIKDKNGNIVKPGLKKVCNDVGCHLILLGQINQDRKTVKGGSSLPHMVDVALDLVPCRREEFGGLDTTGIFKVKVGLKHRHGKKGSVGIFSHQETCINCISDNNIKDKVWCKTHNIRYRTPLQQIQEAKAKRDAQEQQQSMPVEKVGLYRQFNNWLTDVIEN